MRNLRTGADDDFVVEARGLRQPTVIPDASDVMPGSRRAGRRAGP